MNDNYLDLTPDNLAHEHVCCAIGDKKHQHGVACKKAWLAERLPAGHVFRKLDAQGKVFIEFAPLKTAWASVEGENYLYIYCLWVAGSFKEQGHGARLLQYAIEAAKQQHRSGICIIGAKKKKPFLADKKFLQKYGFSVVDSAGDYELLALSFHGEPPRFSAAAKVMRIEEKELTIYHSPQCPFIANCVEQVEKYCATKAIPLRLIAVQSREQALRIPGVFNNWATFLHREYQGTHLLNEGQLKKLLCSFSCEL